jgi:hypothetical protein
MLKLTEQETISLCEGVEARSRADYYSCADEVFKRKSGLVVEVSGTATATLVPLLGTPFFNRVIGFGAARPVGKEEFDALLAMLEKNGARSCMLPLCPAALPAGIPSWLESAGFSPGETWVKLIRGDAKPESVETALWIEEIGSGQGKEFASLVIDVFGMSTDFLPLIQGIVGKPAWKCYMAFSGDEPAAAAAMYVEQGAAWLGFAVTKEAYRSHGAQSALITRRIMDGIKAGCRRFVTETVADLPDKPCQSKRNMLRIGFKAAYERPNWIRM